MCVWIEWIPKNISNLEESAEMLELSEEEEISGSTQRKHSRGSETCLNLTSHVYFDTSTILQQYYFKNAINGNYFTRCLYGIHPPLVSTPTTLYSPPYSYSIGWTITNNVNKSIIIIHIVILLGDVQYIHIIILK